MIAVDVGFQPVSLEPYAYDPAKATEDVQFSDVSAAAEYPFSVAIMDYDGKNHAGAPLQKLIFKP